MGRLRLGWKQASDHVDEELMDAAIAREFRMEGGRKEFALPNQNGKTISFPQYLNPLADTGNARGTDVHHLEWSPGQPGFARLDSTVNLPAVGIAFNADIHYGQTLLGRMRDVAGQQNTAGTSAEDRLLLHKTLQGLKQSVPFKKFQESCGLATGQD